MPIDYSSAGPWTEHVRALAVIESGEDIGKIGDGGRAFGLLQQHPAFFVEWYKKPDVTDTWWNAQIKAAAAFLGYFYLSMGLDQTIQAYNLGVTAVQSGERNPEYLRKWSDAYQRIRGGS